MANETRIMLEARRILGENGVIMSDDLPFSAAILVVKEGRWVALVSSSASSERQDRALRCLLRLDEQEEPQHQVRLASTGRP